jgi:hypothetical protein
MRAAALILSLLAPLALATARADGPPVFLVQYVEATAAGTKAAAAALHEARGPGRKDDGINKQRH